MDIFTVLQIDTYVSYSAALGSPEQQVAQLSFLPIFCLDNLTSQSLLGSITLKDDTIGKVRYFYQSRAVCQLGRGTSPQVTGSHHAEGYLLDEFSVEGLVGPNRKFLHFRLVYIAFASVRSCKFDEFTALTLVFKDIAHNQVAYCHTIFRGIYQLSLVNIHNVSSTLTPCIQLFLCDLIQGILWYIRNVLVRSLYSSPIAIVFQNLDRSTHDGLCSHFSSMFATRTE